MVEEQTYKLKKLIKELEGIKGRHTELVTVYVPVGYSISDISNQIKNEQGTAINIKSKTVRKNVLSALERVVQNLKLYRQTPPNGLAVFSGNISEKEGVADIKIWSIEPPEPLKSKLYWCDQRFELEPLREMIKEKEIYGMVVMDNQQATIGVLRGKKILVLKRMDSIVPGKTAKGGQCVKDESIIIKKSIFGKSKQIKIKDVKENDEILVFDFKNNIPVYSKISKIMKRKSKQSYKVTAKSGKYEYEIIATGEHKFFVIPKNVKFTEFFDIGKNKTEKFVDELEIGNMLIGFEEESKIGSVCFPASDSLCLKIIKIEKINSENVSFSDLEIPVYENFFANNILVHNSAQRFERVREGLKNDFYKMIAAAMKSLLPLEIKGIIFGGSGPAKNTFLDGDYLDTEIKNKIIGIKDVGYTDEHGLFELMERSQDILAEASVARERALIQKFFGELRRDSGLVTYGYNAVMRALNAGAVDTIIISEGVDEAEVELQCNCGYSYKKFLRKENLEKERCPKCGGKAGYMGERDAIEAFEELAKQYGTKIEIISRETREGEQMFQMGGIGAMLRYRL